MILIAGDSWACGEWSSMNIRHGGLSQYLVENNYPALNIGIGGGSNFQTIIFLTNFIKSNQYLQNQIKKIIVFQTEWDRIGLQGGAIGSDEEVKDGYILLKNKWISRFYNHLSELSQEICIPIWVIGGCADTIWLDNFSDEYPGVQVVCQSFTNLLLYDNHRIDRPTHSMLTNKNSSFITAIKKHSDNNDLSELIADLELGENRANLYKSNPEWFWPDGGHANRAGHKKLFDFLVSEYDLGVKELR